MAVGPGLAFFLAHQRVPCAHYQLFVGAGLARVLLAEEVGVGAAQQGGRVVQAEALRHRPVHADKATLRILEVDELGQVVQQRMQQVALVEQFRFGPPPVGDVVDDGVEQAPAFDVHRAGVHLHIASLAGSQGMPEEEIVALLCARPRHLRSHRVRG